VSERTAVYRLFDADGKLLYVGVANNYGRRWEQHAAEKPWWPEIAREAVEWHQDRPSALAAEAHAIMREQPRFNRVSGHLTPGGGIARNRSFRVDDEDWNALGVLVEAAGSTRGAVINQFVRWYLHKGELPQHGSAKEDTLGGD